MSEASTAAGVDRGRAAAPESRTRCCAPLFTGGSGFFLAADKVQVKYEMLRAHLVDGLPVTEAAAAHGYSRAAFYLVAAAFEQSGMAGLLDERRGRRGPVKLRPEIVEFIRAERRARGPRSPSRWPTGSGCGCTGAPSNGSAAGERPVVLAAGRGGAGRLRDAARARCSSTAGCRTGWPRPGSPAAAWPG